MSTTALVWAGLFFLGCIASFVHPFFAMLIYLLDYYQHPPLRWWGGGLPDLRWSLFASMVLLLANFAKGRHPFAPEIMKNPSTRWLLLFLLVAAVVTPFAVSLDRSLHYLADLAKLALLYSLIILSVRTRGQFRIFILVLIVGSFVWGVEAWLDPSRTGGRLMRIGGPDSFSDNSAASHLVPVLPFLLLFLLKGNWWQRLLCFAAAPFIVNTLILCNSRGGTIAVGSMAAAALLFARGRLRLLVLVAVLAGGLAAAFLVDKTFIERQLTTLQYEDDGSAMGRIDAWKGALRLMADRPLGAGGGGFDILSPIYIPDVVEAHGGEDRAVHNTYLWVGSDWGFLGLFFFLMFIFTTLRELHRVGRESSGLSLYHESFALQIGLLGFLVSAFFINRPYAEILYWIAGLTGALRNIQRLEAEAPVREAVETS